MVTHSPSAMQGHYGLMATVWLVLIAMFLGILSMAGRVEPAALTPESPLDALAFRVTVGEVPKTSIPVPVTFFEGQSAQLTEAGRDWLRRFAERAPIVRPGERLGLDILPPSSAHDLTAARVATVAALLGALGADMALVELGSHDAGQSARIRLAGDEA